MPVRDERIGELERTEMMAGSGDRGAPGCHAVLETAGFIVRVTIVFEMPSARVRFPSAEADLRQKIADEGLDGKPVGVLEVARHVAVAACDAR